LLTGFSSALLTNQRYYFQRDCCSNFWLILLAQSSPHDCNIWDFIKKSQELQCTKDYLRLFKRGYRSNYIREANSLAINFCWWNTIHDTKLPRCYVNLSFGWISKFVYNVHLQPQMAGVGRLFEEISAQAY